MPDVLRHAVPHTASGVIARLRCGVPRPLWLACQHSPPPGGRPASHLRDASSAWSSWRHGLQENWAAYTGREIRELPHGHLLPYPLEARPFPPAGAAEASSLGCPPLHPPLPCSPPSPLRAYGHPVAAELARPACSRCSLCFLSPRGRAYAPRHVQEGLPAASALRRAGREERGGAVAGRLPQVPRHQRLRAGQEDPGELGLGGSVEGFPCPACSSAVCSRLHSTRPVIRGSPTTQRHMCVHSGPPALNEL